MNATWCLSNNVGDTLTYWLVSRLSSRPIYVPVSDPAPKLLAVGSVLNWADEHCVVWGSGLAARADGVNPLARIYSVRGPLSRDVAIQCGAKCPEVYGDPGLLASGLYRPRRLRRAALGVVPHYVDQDIVYAALSGVRGVRIINVFDPVEQVIDQICSCRAVVSSSLHGLVLADSYGVPNRWLQGSNRIGGDGSKFADHLLSTGRAVYEPLTLEQVTEVDVLDGWQEPRIDTEGLLAAYGAAVEALQAA